MSVPPISPDDVFEHITGTFAGVVPKSTWGETAFFYNPGMALKNGTYFATIKEKDGDNDRASNLDREGSWRLNMGVRKETFVSLFGPPPKRPGKGQIIEGPWDFAMSDQIMPHPVYGWMGWLAVISPTLSTWDQCKALIGDAHERAKATFEKRVK
ncbi:MAG: DUF6194 family protein [Pseudomonadota bacterium]